MPHCFQASVVKQTIRPKSSVKLKFRPKVGNDKGGGSGGGGTDVTWAVRVAGGADVVLTVRRRPVPPGAVVAPNSAAAANARASPNATAATAAAAAHGISSSNGENPENPASAMLSSSQPPPSPAKAAPAKAVPASSVKVNNPDEILPAPANGNEGETTNGEKMNNKT